MVDLFTVMLVFFVLGGVYNGNHNFEVDHLTLDLTFCEDTRKFSNIILGKSDKGTLFRCQVLIRSMPNPRKTATAPKCFPCFYACLKKRP